MRISDWSSDVCSSDLVADADSTAARRPDGGLDPRAAPTPEFIEQIRRRFPVETAMDRVLTRKMRLRSGPGYSPISLDRLEAGTRRLIARHHRQHFPISTVRTSLGGMSTDTDVSAI